VLCAGRLDVSKGYDLVIQAFPAVLKRIPDAQLLLAVCSETMSHKEQQLLLDLKVLAHRLEIAPSVRFLPCVNQQRLADYYRSADLFVLPSRNEPFGMTAIEAMACGTPTIVTTHGGLWEEMTWGQDCIYCDSLDREAMSQAICSPLMQPSIHKQLARGGAATAAARYTWSQIAVSLLEAASERKMIRMRTRATISLP
jgi:mannosylfructose-phosphate synthase